MNSNFFNLNLRDVAHAAVIAIVAAVLGALQQSVQSHGLDVASFDWGGILDVAITALISALGVKFGTTQDGKFLGVAKIS